MRVRRISIAMLTGLTAYQAIVSAEPTPRHPKVITDSIVSGLSCADLSTESLFRAVRKERMTPDFHLSLSNPKTKQNPRGNCWALSRAQRFITYLAQTDVSDQPVDAERVLDMIQEYVADDSPFTDFRPDRRRVEPEVFPFPLSESAFWMGQKRSLDQLKNNRPRNLEFALDQIQNSQSVRFEGIWYSMRVNFRQARGTRNLQAEREVAQELDRSLAQGWTPMMGISGTQLGGLYMGWDAHAVLIQSSQRLDENRTEYILYDSERPGIATTLPFDQRTGFGSGTVSFMREDAQFLIINRDEKEQIVQAMRRYYSKKCAEL